MKRRTFGILSLIAGFCFVVYFTSCKHDPIIPTNPAMSFKTDVQPIIISNCTTSGCHGGSNSGHHGEGDAFPLLTYQDVMSRTTAYDANNSRIYTSLSGNGEGRMPPNGQLSDRQTMIIYLWIMQGAKDN